MSDDELLHQLSKVLPRSVYDKIYNVRERLYWNVIDVAFKVPWGVRTVHVPKDEWLSDLWIARLCLEAP